MPHLLAMPYDLISIELVTTLPKERNPERPKVKIIAVSKGPLIGLMLNRSRNALTNFKITKLSVALTRKKIMIVRIFKEMPDRVLAGRVFSMVASRTKAVI